MIKLSGSLLALPAALLAVLPVAAPARAATPPSKTQWLADVDRALDGASDYLDTRASEGGRDLAIVLDIDNTSLETYYDEGAATPQVLALAEKARSLGYSVLVATYRSDTRGARADLEAAGYTVDGVCGRISGESGAATTKQRCRAAYADEGYTITANIGNRPTDMAGENYERGFQLPDYDGGLS